jgi:hypothetical protein
VGYDTTIAVVRGDFPRHVEDAWLNEREGKNSQITAFHEVGEKGKVAKGTRITLEDYGSAIVEFNLANVGYDTRLAKFLAVRRAYARESKRWPYYFPVTGKPNKGMRIDLYNEPLGVCRIEEFLEVLRATMKEDAARGNTPFRRFGAVLKLLECFENNDAWGKISVLSYGH